MSLVYEAVCDWWDESFGEVFGMDWGEGKGCEKEKRQHVLYMLPQNCNELFNTFTISENTGAKICGMIQPRR